MAESSIWQNNLRYGWIPDLPDIRDHLYAAPPSVLAAGLPPTIDLRAQCPPIYDQGQLGSCTANATAAAVQFERMKQGLPDALTLVPSRLFIYYNERVAQGAVSQDSGAQLREGIRSVAVQGACFESGQNSWAYDITRYTQAAPPSCYEAARQNEAAKYSRVAQNLQQLRGCLASGYPFVFGFAVYETLQSLAVMETGILPMPASGERSLGGHAVMAVGYDDNKQQFIVRNSWGPYWGLNGYFMMPYAYVTESNLADDFWTIRVVARNQQQNPYD